MLAEPTIAGPQRRQGHGAEHLPRRGAQRGRGLPGPRVERLPRDPDGAHHDGDVEEDQPAHDGDGRAVEAEEAQRAALPQQLAEGDADDDRREHERHEQRGPHRRAARQREPVEGVRRRQPEGDREQRREPGGPHREPGDPVHAGPRQDVEHRARREAPVHHEPLGHHAGHRQDEEHAQHQDRRGREGEQPGDATRSPRWSSGRARSEPGRVGTHREMTSVQSVSHCSRFGVDLGGVHLVGVARLRRELGPVLGDGGAGHHREDVHRLRQRALHLVGEHPVDQRLGARGVVGALQHAGVLHLAEARVEQRRRRGPAAADGEGRGGVVRHDDRAGAVVGAGGEVAVVGVLPPVDDLGAVVEQLGPVVGPRVAEGRDRRQEEGHPGAAGRGARRHEEVAVAVVGEVLEGARRLEALLLEPRGVDVDAHVGRVDRHQPVAALGQGVLRRRGRRRGDLGERALAERAGREGVVDAEGGVGDRVVGGEAELGGQRAGVARGADLEVVAGLGLERPDQLLGQVEGLVGGQDDGAAALLGPRGRGGRLGGGRPVTATPGEAAAHEGQRRHGGEARGREGSADAYVQHV